MILEAVVNRLPTVTTSTGGYAQHVVAAQAGIVIREPFTAPANAARCRLPKMPHGAANDQHQPSDMASNPSFMTAACAPPKLFLALPQSGSSQVYLRQSGCGRGAGVTS